MNHRLLIFVEKSHFSAPSHGQPLDDTTQLKRVVSECLTSLTMTMSGSERHLQLTSAIKKQQYSKISKYRPQMLVMH